jgi:uncharacterized protein YaiE (UPF0345 family)
MAGTIPQQFDGVSVVCKSNVYFDGRVISHTVIFSDGSKKTLGLIYPGSFTFKTGAPERMEIVAGSCRAKVSGESAWTTCGAGAEFRVAGNSSFEIAVESGIAEYICSYE